MIEKLPYEKFLESFTLSPRLAVEILVINSKKELILLQRDTEPFRSYWHLPGGFLLKREHIMECVKRVAHDELKLEIEPSNFKFEGLFENISGDPRGHILHYVLSVNIDKIHSGKFFKTLPTNTIPYQRVFLNKLGFK